MISIRLILTALAAILIFEFSEAKDLFKVTIKNPQQANLLTSCRTEPILVISDGYLVLAEEYQLAGKQLDYRLLASDITREEIFTDNNREISRRSIYPALFEEGELRLVRKSKTEIGVAREDREIYPLPNFKPDIEFQEEISKEVSLNRSMVPLDSLGALVNRDSLESYLLRLEAFYRRYVGTDSGQAARDWLHDKFVSFGYDSIGYDSFPIVGKYGATTGENVLVYKIGAVAPEYQIILSAHRDGVDDSPAADDNGSGVAAVMEIARVLKDIPTQVTFIFGIFDGEEEGLVGSSHYANEAKAHGNKIVFDFNLDMIGNTNMEFPDTNTASIYNGAKKTYSDLWIRLADSLYGMQGILMGFSNRSDHYSFQQNGYMATFVMERTWSPVYHTPRDSVRFLNFNYLTRMVKASLATVYAGSESFVPSGELIFNFPDGQVATAEPWIPPVVKVEVGGKYGDRPDPATVKVHFSVNGAQYLTEPMQEISPGLYSATLPPAECTSRIDYFVTAKDTVGVDFSFPDSTSPNRILVTSGSEVVFEDNFETNKGWLVSGTVTSGAWNRGIPAGGGDRGDPPTDFDGSGRCFATDTSDGDADVDGGTTYLVSPVFDLSGADALIHYAAWYYDADGLSPHRDTLKIFLSNDEGINWTIANMIGPTEKADGGWYEYSIWARDYLPMTSKMRLLFQATDLQSAVVEAAIDDVRIAAYRCPPYICGDINGNGSINVLDITMLINFLYKGGRGPDRMVGADLNGDAAVNVLDVTYFIGNLYKDGPPPNCR